MGGGNHDYILEQMGPDNARLLCEKHGINYLHEGDEPQLIKLGENFTSPLRIWGTAVSTAKAMSAAQSVRSGNSAFQVAPEDEAAFLERTIHVTTDVDIMVSHVPPCDVLRGKPGNCFPTAINTLID